MQADYRQIADLLDFSSRRAASEQVRNNLHVQPQTPGFAQYLRSQVSVVGRRQYHLVDKACTRQSSQVIDTPDHLAAQRPVVVQKAVHRSPRSRMLFHVRSYAPSDTSRPDNQNVAHIAQNVGTMPQPGTLPTPSPQRAKVQNACSAEQTACCPWRSEEHTSELQSHVNLVCRLL